MNLPLDHPRLLRLVFILCFLHTASAKSQELDLRAPKAEVRAVWVTTTNGLDWPKSKEKSEQQSSLRTIVRRLKAANFNTIIFQVRARGDAYYRSRYEPWAENLTGTPGKDPGYDPLAFLLEEAHRVGMEVHAWFNVYKVRGPNPAPRTWPPHVGQAYPQWIREYQNEGWLDPGLPEVRSHLLRVALELVRNYEVDGINFDFVRYPGRDFRDEETYARYGKGMPLDAWRRSNIDNFVAAFYDSATTVKSMLKVGAAPLGLFNGETNGRHDGGAVNWFYQDAPGWLRNKKLDYVTPQIYWSIGTNNGQGFAQLARAWQRNSAGRHVYTGIAAYKSEVMKELPGQIDSARASGALGQAYFRYENIERLTMFGSRYETPATIPPMPWKDSVSPKPPTQLAVSEIAPNIFHLEWKPEQPAADGDTASRYAIYRSTLAHVPVDNPRLRAVITPNNANYFIDTIRMPQAIRYYYAVTSLDKGNNESAPSGEGQGEVKEAMQLEARLASTTKLAVSVSPDEETPVMIAYELEEMSLVSLEVVERLPSGTELRVAALTDGTRQEGTHVVGMRSDKISTGKYVVRMKSRPVSDATNQRDEIIVERVLDFRRR